MKFKPVFSLATLLLVLTFFACQNQVPQADAYGNFEAEERIVSAEANGKILDFKVEEGQMLQAGQRVGGIDSLQIVLKRAQLEASIEAIIAKSPAIKAQLQVFERQMASVQQQMSTLQIEQKRVENLLKSDAATPKQLDDIKAQIIGLQKQMDLVGEQKTASNATLDVQKNGLLAEVLPLRKQMAQLDDQLDKCNIINPIDGMVLVKYAEPGEVTAFGKPLYKVANLSVLTLRAYVAGDQLTQVKLGQAVTVLVDGPNKTLQEFSGKVEWISPKAEFTPKVIQTKEERVNLVYAIKVAVPNETQALKIGMPAELKW